MSKLNLIIVIAIASVMLASVVTSITVTSHISNAFAQGNASSRTSMTGSNMTGYYGIHNPDHPLRLPSDNMIGMSMSNSSIPMTNSSK
jgi:hypothetical protein